MSDGTSNVCLSFDKLTVSVSGGDPSHRDWLVEFLVPDFQIVESGTAGCSVDVLEDTTRYTYTIASVPGPDAPLYDCFSLDSNVVRLPVLERRGTATTVFDEQFESVYTIEPDRNHVTILSRSDNPRVRASMLRIVREFAMNEFHRKGLFLHASAIAVGSNGVAIAGHKAAGKTTLLTYLLSSRSGAYLSNDRVFASENGGRLELRNIPTVISVRPGTLDLCPGFRDRFLTSGFASYLETLDESAKTGATEILKNQFGNYFISPAQYRNLLDATQKTRAWGGALVFPAIRDDLETFELRELSMNESLLRMPHAFLGSGTWRKGTDSFTIPATSAAPSDAKLEERAQQLCRHMRCYELRLGPRSYVDASLAAAITDLAW